MSLPPPHATPPTHEKRLEIMKSLMIFSMRIYIRPDTGCPSDNIMLEIERYSAGNRLCEPEEAYPVVIAEIFSQAAWSQIDNYDRTLRRCMLTAWPEQAAPFIYALSQHPNPQDCQEAHIVELADLDMDAIANDGFDDLDYKYNFNPSDPLLAAYRILEYRHSASWDKDWVEFFDHFLRFKAKEIMRNQGYTPPQSCDLACSLMYAPTNEERLDACKRLLEIDRILGIGMLAVLASGAGVAETNFESLLAENPRVPQPPLAVPGSTKVWIKKNTINADARDLLYEMAPEVAAFDSIRFERPCFESRSDPRIMELMERLLDTNGAFRIVYESFSVPR
jgi:hypothetical protein